MSYDITGSVAESCSATTISTATATITYACTSHNVGSSTASWSLSCTSTAVGSSTASWTLSCSSVSVGVPTGSWGLTCSSVDIGVDTIAGDGDGYVFEEGLVVQTGDPGENDFVYIRDPETGDDELVSTFREDSILTFVEDKGVVSLPPSD